MSHDRTSGTLILSLFTLLAAAAARPAIADDWPQWRGPTRDGISRETGLLREWPADGPRLLWQVKDVGSGYSTPAIAGERLYLLGNKGNDDESVRAFSVKDGQPLWSTRLGKVGNPAQFPNYPAARSTPTVEGDRLYALGSDGDLACLESATGKPVWQKNLRTDFGGQPGTWAYSESPLIDGEALVCTPGGKDATLVKLDKKTGQVIWKSPVPGGDAAGYASVVVTEAGGVRQYVQFLQNGLVGVDAGSGRFLWRYDRTAKGSPANIPTPLARDGYVYSGASRSGGGLVRLKADPAATGAAGAVQAEQVYFSPKLPTAIGGAVLVGDDLYGATGQVLLCAAWKTGDIKWTSRGVGPASVCFADGRLYLHGENGEVALVEATPEAYREKGRFTPPGQPDRGSSKAWAYPAIADGRLYVRDMDRLWCYDVKAGEAGK